MMAPFEEHPEKHPLLLWKGIYSYEYMNSWSLFEEKTLLPKDSSFIIIIIIIIIIIFIFTENSMRYTLQ